MKRSRANAPERSPDILVKRPTNKKEKRQVSSSTVSKAPATAVLDMQNLFNVTGDSDPNRIMTDTPIDLLNEEEDPIPRFNQRIMQPAFNTVEFQKNIEAFLDEKFRHQDEQRRKERSTFNCHVSKQSKRTNLSFKFKSNKLQFSFLNEVLDLAEEAKDLLECGSKKRLASTLDDITTAVAKRQKVIRLADKSLAGWSTVDEYLQDELASDSDDNKKMRQAEARALAKLRRDRSSDKGNQFRRYSSQKSPSTRQNQVPVFQSPYTPPVLQTAPVWPQYLYPQQSVSRPVQSRLPSIANTPVSGRYANPLNVCFECGQPGHWKHSCPNKQKIKGNHFIKSSLSSLQIKGNLRRNVEYWEKTLKASPFILSIIQQGYKIPFRYLPPSFEMKNNKSAKEHSEFVESSILELIVNKRIYEVKKPFVSNPLSVAIDSKGKKRLILDLSSVNEFVWKQKVKFDDWKMFENFIDADGEAFLFKFDLKSGYHHVDMHIDSQKYLGFAWTFKDGSKKYFQFSVLPFGLTSAPFIFTKIIRVLIKYWRAHAIRIACFIDDGLAIDYSQTKASSNSQFVRDTLDCAGFLSNQEKSEWVPKNTIEWLGIRVDFTNKTYHISDNRIFSALNSIHKILNHPSHTSARKLSRVVGKIVSTKFVLGSIVLLKTKFLYKVIETQVSLDKNFNLLYFHDAIKELLFWKSNLVSLNKRPIIEYNVPHLKVFSDASNTGIGALNGNKIRYRNLNGKERSQSSTYRELLAITHSTRSFDVNLKNKNVLWHTDNCAAAIIVKKGSNKLLLQNLAIKVYNLCREKEIALTVTWISRKHNERADEICKSVDYDDWQITSLLIQFIYKNWDYFSIDLFADNLNAKCTRFCSRYWCPNTLKVNAFSLDWTGENCLMVPPTYLIAKCIKHFLAAKGEVKGVLIIPFWPSAVFWPLLVENDQSFRSFIVNYMFFKSSKNLVVQGEFKGSIIGHRDYNVPIIVLFLKKLNSI